MTHKSEQRSVALVNNLRGYMNGQIDMLLRTLEDRQAQLEQAFLAEVAHLDDLYSDKLTEDDDALESVLRFDKGYAKTMAAIQAATERLVEARAHLARITNTIEYHPAFSRNGCNAVAHKDLPINVALDCTITGALDSKTVVKHNQAPIVLSEFEEHIITATSHTTKETNHE